MIRETCYLSTIQAVPRLPLLEGPYIKLSDGSLQPLSGSRIIGTDDKRKLDATKPFSMNPNRLVTFKWSINNRFNSQTEYAKGYGGIAQYEVATAVSTHSDWFKKTKHL